MKLRNYLLGGAAALLTLSAGSAKADFASTLSSLNPAGWWRLNEAAFPFNSGVATNSGSIGAAGDGTFFFAPTLQVEGALGAGQDPAANFNGSSQYVEVPYHPGLNPSGPFTVEFWANLTNISAGAKSGPVSRYITVAGGPTGQFGYLFFANNGNSSWQFRIYNGTAGVTVTDTTPLAADTWYHVVGVYDGTQIKIYVNGVASAAPVPGTCVINTNTPLRIGAGTTETAPSLYFPGKLDEVAIYPTALSDAQILANYNTAISNPSAYAAQVQGLSPNAYWRLNSPTVPPLPLLANSGSLGSAFDGQLSFGVTNGVPGPRQTQFAGFEAANNSISLNASSGFINIAPLPHNTDHYTMTCWIKRQGSEPSFAGIMFTRPSATGLTFDGANRLSYTWNDAANTYNFNSTLTVPESLWTFAALVVTPTNAVVYMGSTNGLTSRTNTVAHAPHDFSTAAFWLGRDQSTARFMRGGLDEAAVFDTALSYDDISNLFFSATPALMNVTRTPANPVFEGVTVTYTASAVSTAPLNYQWRKDGATIGGNSPVLTLNNVSPANNGNYDVIVTAGSQSVTSVVDVLSVVAGPPVVLAAPQSITRYAGVTATFSVTAGGSTPFSYQWSKGATPIPDATNATLVLNNISAADAANYTAQITNPNGNITSAPATLTVLPAPSAYGAIALARQADVYFSLNETAGTTTFDYAGGGTGTYPAPPAVVPGVVGPRAPTLEGFTTTNTSFQLDGITGWVTCAPLNWTGNQVTFSAWVNLTGYDDGLSGVVFCRDANANGIHIESTGELRYHWNNGQWAFGSGITVPLNEWVFLALVVEADQGTLYMGTSSGLVSAVNSATHASITLSDPLFLGRDRTDRPLIGSIDEVALFNRSLSLDDISALYAVGFGVPLTMSLTPGGYVVDSKTIGTPHHGASYSVGWSASETDLSNVTRTGVGLFNTTNLSQIITPAHPDFDSTTGTIAFWLKAGAPIPGPGDEAAIIFDRRTDAGTVITLDDSGAIFVQATDGLSSGGANSFSAGYLPDDNWHHVAVTYDQALNGLVEIYIDGNLVAANQNATNWAWPTSQPIEIGRSHDGYWKRLNGQLDDFRIYNRILNATEVASLASSGAVVDATALKLRYNFDNTGIGYTVNWPFGALQSSPVLGPSATWTNVPGALPPSLPILPTEGTRFFRATY